MKRSIPGAALAFCCAGLAVAASAQHSPRWVHGATCYESLRPLVLRQRRRRHRRPEGAHREARLHQRWQPASTHEPRRAVHLADAHRRVAELSRLRRHRLLSRRAANTARTTISSGWSRPRTSAGSRARGHGAQPHVERASVVPGGDARHRLAVSQLVSLVAHDRRTRRDHGGRSVWHKSPVRDEYYYGVFWSGMPDLNYETPAVRAEAKKIATSG